jgi:hypothetical protein
LSRFPEQKRDLFVKRRKEKKIKIKIKIPPLKSGELLP